MKIRKRRKFKIILILSFFAVIFFSYFYFIASPVIKTYSQIEIASITEKAINLAVSNVVNRTLSYDALIDINYGQTGEIVSFSANQYEINSITREIVKETQYQLNHISNDELKLNLGTLTGIPMFLGRGPKVILKLVPIGVVNGSFNSQFSSVGINMTKHTLLLYINVHIGLVMPIKTYNFHTSNQVLLAESIIVGKVPEVYLNGGSLGKSLNLVP